MIHRTFTLTDQEPDSADANLDAASAPSTFIQLGVPALAVVMRLQTRLPRIKVASPPRQQRREKPEEGSLS